MIQMLFEKIREKKLNKTIISMGELIKYRLFVGFLESFNEKSVDECKQLAEHVALCTIAGVDFKGECETNEVDSIEKLIESTRFQSDLKSYRDITRTDAQIEINFINNLYGFCIKEKNMLEKKFKLLIMRRIEGDKFSFSKAWTLIKVKDYEFTGHTIFIFTIVGTAFASIGYAINNIIASIYGFDADILFNTQDYFMTGIKPLSNTFLFFVGISLWIIYYLINENNDERYADEVGIKYVSKMSISNKFSAVIITLIFILSLIDIFICYINETYPSVISVCVVANVIFTQFFVLLQSFKLKLKLESRAFILLYGLICTIPYVLSLGYEMIRPHLVGEYESNVVVKYKDEKSIRTLPLIIKGGEGSLVYDSSIGSARFIHEKNIISHDMAKIPVNINTNNN
ncbi:hypothetical protein AB3A98_004047 [Vibrio parahaemolyticus]